MAQPRDHANEIMAKILAGNLSVQQSADSQFQILALKELIGLLQSQVFYFFLFFYLFVFKGQNTRTGEGRSSDPGKRTP